MRNPAHRYGKRYDSVVEGMGRGPSNKWGTIQRRAGMGRGSSGMRRGRTRQATDQIKHASTALNLRVSTT